MFGQSELVGQRLMVLKKTNCYQFVWCQLGGERSNRLTEVCCRNTHCSCFCMELMQLLFGEQCSKYSEYVLFMCSTATWTGWLMKLAGSTRRWSEHWRPAERSNRSSSLSASASSRLIMLLLIVVLTNEGCIFPMMSFFTYLHCLKQRW